MLYDYSENFETRRNTNEEDYLLIFIILADKFFFVCSYILL